jgi:RNA polymerase sigma-70 factor (ECF subfamily)
MHPTPVSLLQRLARPEDRAAAWARFVDLYTPLLFAWASRLNVPEQDAADLIQNVFLTLLRRLPSFRYDQDGSFRGWLRTVLLHQWRDQLRRIPPPVAVAPAVLDGRGAGPDPVEELAETEYRRCLAGRAMQLMQSDFTPSTWRACWETVVQERPAAEVAADLGLSVAAVYAATSRVLRRLRQELEGLLD